MKEFDLNRTIALAGIIQALKLVRQLATRGYAQVTEFKIALDSLLITDPQTTLDVFGGNLNNIRFGLEEIIKILSGSSISRDPDLIKYILSVIHLEKQLHKKPELTQELSRGIRLAINQNMHFPVPHPNLIANFASIYQNTFSKLDFRIQVGGDSAYLNNTETVNKIRALLLSAIRATMLWRQLGGSRWQLIFNKKNIIGAANYLTTVKNKQSQVEFAE